MSNRNASLAMGYAKAVYEIALESWQTNLKAVSDALVANPRLAPKLDDLAVAFEQRRQDLDGLLPENISEQGRNFFYALLKEGNLHLLSDVNDNLTMMITRTNVIQKTVVTTAVELSDDEKEQFKAKLIAKYGENLDVDFKVDAEIMGGVIVQVGDKILDGSVIAKLNAMRNVFKSVS